MDINIYAIIDGSGSMRGVKDEVVKGINEFIDEQKIEAVTTGDTIKLSLTSFDTNVHSVYLLEDISLVNHVTVADTFHGGSTALYDAIGRTLSKGEDDVSDRNLVVIYTDGHENASREFNTTQIRELKERLENTKKWQFMYLGAEFDDFAKEAQNIGITSTAGTSKRGVATTWKNVSDTSTYYRTAPGAAVAGLDERGGLAAAAAQDLEIDWEAEDTDEVSS